ncbi:hypothetical protein GGH95_000931 [Coemansia sp. RSA 1836]|nr:hypothetical protein GGH95_000931 [Coemansia sp. RSA 1836]
MPTNEEEVLATYGDIDSILHAIALPPDGLPTNTSSAFDDNDGIIIVTLTDLTTELGSSTAETSSSSSDTVAQKCFIVTRTVTAVAS